MSLTDRIEGLLPYMRRYARASTGNTQKGDACVERVLKDMLDQSLDVDFEPARFDPSDNLSGIDLGSDVSDPDEDASDLRTDARVVQAHDRAGDIDDRSHLTKLRCRNLDARRREATEVALGERDIRQRAQGNKQQATRPYVQNLLHHLAVRGCSVVMAASPERAVNCKRLGNSNRVNNVETDMPPTIAAAIPR